MSEWCAAATATVVGSAGRWPEWLTIMRSCEYLMPASAYAWRIACSIFTMARGLSREQSKEKNAKAAAGANKGNQEGISATVRAERDAQKLSDTKNW